MQVVFGSDFVWEALAFLTEVLYRFPHSPQANTRVIPELDFDRFLPNPFDFFNPVIKLSVLQILPEMYHNSHP
jgi:hypothetical protein